jgi:hypothetical protein
MTATMTDADLVTTATLLRGRVYVYRSVSFERGVPVVVTDDLAAELEEMFDEVRDADQEIIEKPLFSVLYDVPKPPPVLTVPTRRRPPANVRSAQAAAGTEAPEVIDEAPRSRIRRRPRGTA